MRRSRNKKTPKPYRFGSFGGRGSVIVIGLKPA